MKITVKNQYKIVIIDEIYGDNSIGFVDNINNEKCEDINNVEIDKIQRDIIEYILLLSLFPLSLPPKNKNNKDKKNKNVDNIFHCI